MRIFLFAAWMAAGLLGGCDRRPADTATAGTGPAFDPVSFFTGHTRSWGVLEDRSGAPTQHIETESHGQVNAASQLRMRQHLSFQNGETQDRDWTLWRTSPGHFEATANDMVGTAKGESDGRMFHWQWVLARSPGNPVMDVTMNQWMYALDDGSVMIRTTITKVGIIVAEVTEQFTHADKDDGATRKLTRA